MNFQKYKENKTRQESQVRFSRHKKLARDGKVHLSGQDQQ